MGTPLAYGQQASPPPAEKALKPVLIHIAPTSQTLPDPGAPLDLVVRLKNTRDTERKLRAFVVRDGQMMELSQTHATFNLQEEPTYTISTEAPLGEILYQFLLTNPDGSYSPSEKYYVRRSCIPDVAPSTTTLTPDLQGEPRFNELLKSKDLLQRDIALYEHVRSLLTDLKDLIKE